MGNAKKNKVNIGIFDPYLNILGGGERFILTIAQGFASYANVDIFWNSENIRGRIKERFGMNLDNVHFRSFPNNFLKRTSFLRNYAHFFYVTDGSLFLSCAQKSYVIIQSPSHVPCNDSWSDKLKLSTWSKLLCYSKFMASIIEKKLGKSPIILAPPVDIENFKASRKENIILSTGRFFTHLHSKKQGELIQAFKELYDRKKLDNWHLVLVGSATNDEDVRHFTESLRKQAQGYPIDILTNVSFKQLQEVYGKAKIFWLATGLNENLLLHPEKAEHFGMVTVEAMAAKCVPIVYKAGGQEEIVDHGVNGYLFNSIHELETYTYQLVTDETERKQLSEQAHDASKRFSKSNFFERLHAITEF